MTSKRNRFTVRSISRIAAKRQLSRSSFIFSTLLLWDSVPTLIRRCISFNATNSLLVCLPGSRDFGAACSDYCVQGCCCWFRRDHLDRSKGNCRHRTGPDVFVPMNRTHCPRADMQRLPAGSTPVQALTETNDYRDLGLGGAWSRHTACDAGMGQDPCGVDVLE